MCVRVCVCKGQQVSRSGERSGNFTFSFFSKQALPLRFESYFLLLCVSLLLLLLNFFLLAFMFTLSVGRALRVWFLVWSHSFIYIGPPVCIESLRTDGRMCYATIVYSDHNSLNLMHIHANLFLSYLIFFLVSSYFSSSFLSFLDCSDLVARLTDIIYLLFPQFLKSTRYSPVCVEGLVILLI